MGLTESPRFDRNKFYHTRPLFDFSSAWCSVTATCECRDVMSCDTVLMARHYQLSLVQSEWTKTTATIPHRVCECESQPTRTNLGRRSLSILATALPPPGTRVRPHMRV